jgi:chemotaxis protein methyltransferase CheR
MLQTVLPEDIPAAVMERLSARVAAVLGLYYPPQRWSDLLRSIRAALRDSDEGRTRLYIEKLADSPWQAHDIEILTPYLTVGETYFWREPQALVALQTQVLPPLIQARRGGSRRLSLWSAGCCTGEEPYSLAILLHKMLPDIADWDIQVLGTDLNPNFLKKAEQGKYRPWSFRGTPQWIKERYFQSHDGETYSILPEIKRLVTFAPLNLAADNYPSHANATDEIDVIFCRNVLIYMDAAHTHAILDGFVRCLKQGGWLALSATETWLAQSTKLVPTSFEGAMLFHNVPNHTTRLVPRCATSTRLHSAPIQRRAFCSNRFRKILSVAQRRIVALRRWCLHRHKQTTQPCKAACKRRATKRIAARWKRRCVGASKH